MKFKCCIQDFDVSQEITKTSNSILKKWSFDCRSLRQTRLGRIKDRRSTTGVCCGGQKPSVLD